MFEGLWTNESSSKKASFSDVIGASHSFDFSLWDYGEHASDGIKALLKKGSPLMLESELKDQSEHIRTIIKARGLSYPSMIGKSFAVFRVDARHHLMSLVSRLEASKELSVGVSGYELCLPNCTWVYQAVVNLYPWIEKSGFIRKTRNGMEKHAPIARLHITRQSLYDDDCDMQSDAAFNRQSEEDEEYAGDDGENYADDVEDDDDDDYESEDDNEQCTLTDWSEWTDCNNSCGKGERSRSRRYKVNGEQCEKDNDDILREVEECVGIDCPEDYHQYDTVEVRKLCFSFTFTGTHCWLVSGSPVVHLALNKPADPAQAVST